MDLREAARDPYLYLGDLDFALNGVGPSWLRMLGALLALGGVALSIWGRKDGKTERRKGGSPHLGGTVIPSRARDLAWPSSSRS